MRRYNIFFKGSTIRLKKVYEQWIVEKNKREENGYKKKPTRVA